MSLLALQRSRLPAELMSRQPFRKPSTGPELFQIRYLALAIVQKAKQLKAAAHNNKQAAAAAPSTPASILSSQASLCTSYPRANGNKMGPPPILKEDSVNKPGILACLISQPGTDSSTTGQILSPEFQVGN